MFQRFTPDQIKTSILRKLSDNFGCDLSDATNQQIYLAVAQTVRDEVMERRTASRGERKRQGAKKLYYLSAEFLVGRALHNNMVNLVNEEAYRTALTELGIDRDSVFELEPEPGLGNGGLGRLAACFLDSLTTMELPAMGCTIRYEYGLFRQRIVDGYQVEVPDNWLENGNIWEIARPDQTQVIRFGGHLEQYTENGRLKFRLTDATEVEAVPYDIPCVGYDTTMVNMLRVWSARSPKRIDMQSFNSGQYVRAVAERATAEAISKVLYPNDDSYEGKELRLKQQYFFSAASVRYAVWDFKKVHGKNWGVFADKVIFHINDTHPAIAIPELMRILMDEEELSWEEAERICSRCFAYTNHTVLQEALERWPQDLVRKLLPRIYMILEEMNRRLCERLWNAFPGQWDRIGQMAILGYGNVHMANLAVSTGLGVNGVSAIHTDILRKQTFRDYCIMQPSRFVSITNGITHRRWLIQSNPALSSLIDEAIGEGWRKEPQRLNELAPFADDASFLSSFDRVKHQNKLLLADRLWKMQGVVMDPDSIFDAQAKRLHEYKRQIMNALYILMLYNRICDNPGLNLPPTTFIFGAKAAPGYQTAKMTIKLINAIGDLIRKHPRASQMINVVFIENYSVSSAEYLFPASDISEQISTAGKEASGTGNMKFMMNGAVTLGTMDGANCEIFEQVGPENMYVFGMSAEEVEKSYSTYRAGEIYETDLPLRRAMEQMIDGTLSPSDPRLFSELYHALLFGSRGAMADPYFVLKDLGDYSRVRRRMTVDYTDRGAWNRKAVINVARSGIFSSDRTIAEYNEKIWHLKPVLLPR